MTDSDREQFGCLLTALAATFRIETDEAMLEGYWLALDDVSISNIRRAVKRAMRECKFMPTARELRDLTGELSAQHRAILAFEQFSRAVVEVGGYRSIEFDDPVINATVRNLGGWERFCSMPVEEFDKWARKDFERVYTALLATGIADEQAAALPGICEQRNAFLGHEPDSVSTGRPVRFLTGLPAHKRNIRRIAPDAPAAIPRLTLKNANGVAVENERGLLEA